MNMKITLVLTVIVLSVNSAPGLHRRNKRSLGLLAAGYNTLVGDGADGFLGGVLGGVASPFNDLTTLQKIGVSIPIAKAVGLGLLGKYALYEWITKGSNVGVQADVGLGPLTLSTNAGLETISNQQQGIVGDYWYEPIGASPFVTEVEAIPVEVLEADASNTDNSPFFGLQGGVALGPLGLNGGIQAGR